MRKIILAGALFIIGAATNASAEAPNLFTYQGRLKEGGQAVSGSRSVEIKLCPVETGGVCETTGAQPVAVSNGLFRSTFTIPAAVNFGTGSWWLEIWVGGDQLTPRERLTSNAYSLFSATAAYAENISAAAGSDGVYISSNLYVTGGKYYGDGSQLQNLPVSGGAVAKTGDAMTGQLTLYGSTLTVGGNAFSVGGAAFRVENGKIGIGTVAPSGILEINGTDNPQLLLTDLSGDVTFAMRYSNGAPRHILGVPYYNDRVVLTNKNAPFPSQPDSALLLWDSGVTSLQMGTGGYLSFLAGTATEKARFTPAGNFGIGTTAPLYRLVVSSAAGEAGNMLVISTGTSDVIRLTGAGEIYANYYHGDGSQLSGITATAYTGTLPIANGGTNSTNAADARTNLGLGSLAVLSAVGSGEITDASVANADLAGSIADSKLNAITTAGKVDGSAITNLANLPAGAGAIPSANMPATISYLGGDISGAEIVDDTIVDADINSAAAISISKLAASGTLGAGVLVSSVSISAFYSAPEVRSSLGLAVGTDVLAPNGDASALTGVVHSNGDEAIAGLKVFTTTVSVNHSVLVKGNYALMLSTNIGYGGGLRHDQSGSETMVMAVRNVNSKIYLATGYDVSPNAGGALALPASPEITVFNGMVGIKDTTPNSELDVTGQVNATGGLCIGGNCKTSWSSVDNLGDHTATQALNMADRPINSISTASLNGIIISSGTGDNYFAGNVGIGASAPLARIDVISTGTASNIYAQVWRNGSGVAVASITSQGTFYGTTGSGDNLGNHNAANNLQLNWNNIYTVSTITASGDITAANYQINGSTVLSVLNGDANLGIGVNAGRQNTAGYNVFAGYGAGGGDTAGGANVIIGYNAGSNNSGDFSTLIGYMAGFDNAGNYNSFMGYSAGLANTTGNNNIALGNEAAYYNKIGAANTVLGIGAGRGVNTFSFSSATLVGYHAGYGLSTGNDNILIGFQAGDNLQTGGRNIIIGYDQNATASTISDELNIGGLLRGNLNAGTIGIGFTNTIPLAALDVKSTGTASNIYAQVWRDSGGTIVASMTSSGNLQTAGTIFTRGAAYALQNVDLSGTVTTFAADGSGVVLITQTADTNNIATIAGCDSGVVAQGQQVLFIAEKYTAGAFTFTDTPVGSVAADNMVLANALSVSAASASGTTLTLVCTTINSSRAWVEVTRTVNTD